MDRGAWQATDHGIVKSQTRLSKHALFSVPGSERSPGEGNGNPLQYSCLENSMDRGTWRATVHGITKESDTTKCVGGENRLCVSGLREVRTSNSGMASKGLEGLTVLLSARLQQGSPEAALPSPAVWGSAQARERLLEEILALNHS